MESSRQLHNPPKEPHQVSKFFSARSLYQFFPINNKNFLLLFLSFRWIRKNVSRGLYKAENKIVTSWSKSSMLPLPYQIRKKRFWSNLFSTSVKLISKNIAKSNLNFGIIWISKFWNWNFQFWIFNFWYGMFGIWELWNLQKKVLESGSFWLSLFGVTQVRILGFFTLFNGYSVIKFRSESSVYNFGNEIWNFKWNFGFFKLHSALKRSWSVHFRGL